MMVINMNKLLPQTVRKRLNEIHADYQKVKLENEQEYDLAIKELRSRCPHKNVKYNRDPSGGSDSSYSCEDCLLEQDTRPPTYEG
jgi:hypothetical protein